MAHDHSHAEQAHEHHGPKSPARAFAFTLGALLVLTFITVGASYINFGSGTINIVIALTIATIKASLVALIFMHLRWDKPVNGVIAISGFLFLGIFLMFCLIDIDSRQPYEPINVKPGPTMPAPMPSPAPGANPAPPNPAAH
jgi:cytochrome c oxidase subunit 4